MCKDKLSDEELGHAAGGAAQVDFSTFSFHCEYAPNDATLADWLTNKRYYVVPCIHRTPSGITSCRSCKNLQIHHE